LCIAYPVFAHVALKQSKMMVDEIAGVSKRNGYFITSIFEKHYKTYRFNWVCYDKYEFVSMIENLGLKYLDTSYFPEIQKLTQTVLVFKKS